MSASPLDWETIADQISQRKCTPVVGNALIGQAVFGVQNISELWSEHEKYPLAERRNLTRVAQYLSFTRGDALRAKRSYLRFLNEQLLAQVERTGVMDAAYLEQVRREARTLSFSQLACDRLRHPNFKRDLANPLSILAALDAPLFLTTSPHRILEGALRAWGKEPRSEVYAWREDLEELLPADVLPDPTFVPDVKHPLVFHLHGIDDEPRSLVLTEDDQLEFLVNITQDMRDAQAIRKEVRNAISTTLLLLLGYRMHAWDLRVLLQGILRKKSRSGQLRSFVAQLEPQQMNGVLDADSYTRYLTNYFDRIDFDIYWGTPQQFLQTLWQTIEEGR